jgi:hypothetical protein
MPMRLEGPCRCGAISFSVDSHTLARRHNRARDEFRARVNTGMGAGAALRCSMSPAKSINEAFRPGRDRDPSHFLASDQPGTALIG